MGVAITSGVLASLQPHMPFNDPQKWESYTPGTSSPTRDEDASLPTRFMACVKRHETAKNLVQMFAAVPGSSAVEVWADRNVEAVQEADVVLLWCVSTLDLFLTGLIRVFDKAASRSSHRSS
jgi:pyrroline-5-carboxylate reductase